MQLCKHVPFSVAEASNDKSCWGITTNVLLEEQNSCVIGCDSFVQPLGPQMCIEHCTCTETPLPCAIRVLLRMIPQAKASIPVCRAVVVPPCTTVSHRCPARVPPVSRPCPAACPAGVPPVSRRCPAVSRRVPPCPAGVPPVSRRVPPRPCPALSRPVPPCPAVSRRVPPLSLAFFCLRGVWPGVRPDSRVSGRTPGVSGRTAPDARPGVPSATSGSKLDSS